MPTIIGGLQRDEDPDTTAPISRTDTRIFGPGKGPDFLDTDLTRPIGATAVVHIDREARAEVAMEYATFILMGSLFTPVVVNFLEQWVTMPLTDDSPFIGMDVLQEVMERYLDSPNVVILRS